jgi:hypothetical protein
MLWAGPRLVQPVDHLFSHHPKNLQQLCHRTYIATSVEENLNPESFRLISPSPTSHHQRASPAPPARVPAPPPSPVPASAPIQSDRRRRQSYLSDKRHSSPHRLQPRRAGADAAFEEEGLSSPLLQGLRAARFRPPSVNYQFIAFFFCPYRFLSSVLCMYACVIYFFPLLWLNTN